MPCRQFFKAKTIGQRLRLWLRNHARSQIFLWPWHQTTESNNLMPQRCYPFAVDHLKSESRPSPSLGRDFIFKDWTSVGRLAFISWWSLAAAVRRTRRGCGKGRHAARKHLQMFRWRAHSAIWCRRLVRANGVKFVVVDENSEPRLMKRPRPRTGLFWRSQPGRAQPFAHTGARFSLPGSPD
jgi:hypothetical protein